MGASCGGDVDDEMLFESYKAVGLQGQHAYSVLDVKAVGQNRCDSVLISCQFRWNVSVLLHFLCYALPCSDLLHSALIFSALLCFLRHCSPLLTPAFPPDAQNDNDSNFHNDIDTGYILSVLRVPLSVMA